MNKTLGKLWDSFLMEDRDPTAEERKVLKAVVEVEDKLYPVLSEEQRELLLELTCRIEEMNSVSEKNAFIRGIRFATGYMLDTFCEE